MSLRAIAFTKTTAIGPSSRYRYVQYQARLARLGVELVVRPLFGAFWFRLLRWPEPLRSLAKLVYAPLCFALRVLQCFGSRATDVVVVEHQLFPYLPAWGEALLAKRRLGYVLEFDDAIYLTFAHRAKLERMCASARMVVVGNEFLAQFARPHARAVEISPTTIDLARYPASPPSRTTSGRRLVIGWIGLPYNFDALESLAAPLRELAREVDFVLRVVSAGAPSLPGVDVECVPWTEDGEVAVIREFDVGVMPLKDDEWSRGKCGLKILQYFAAFVPVVASPVGVNASIVDHGINGFLARNADEWRSSLRSLLADPDLRARFGAAGRSRVEERFDANREAVRIAERIRRLAGDETR